MFVTAVCVLFLLKLKWRKKKVNLSFFQGEVLSIAIKIICCQGKKNELYCTSVKILTMQ